MAITKKEQKQIAAQVYMRLSLLAAVVLVALGGVLWGVGSYAQSEVHRELAAQHVYFPAKGSPAFDPNEFPDIQKYAGQQVDNGTKAMAYANGFIGRHLQKIAGGKTYAEISTLAMANPKDAALQGQKQTLFQGEMLRSALLGSGYGYGLMGQMAQMAAVASWAGAAGLTVIALLQARRARG